MRTLIDARIGAGPLAESFAASLARGRPVAVTRRQFLKATGMAGGGLMLAIGLGESGMLGGRLAAAEEGPAAPAPKVYPPAAFIRIGDDDRVTVMVGKLEFGQGVHTSMPMLIVEELDCDWDKVRAEHAPADPVYGHPAFGMQFTGGSMSIASSYTQMRTIGATARQMLMSAAAKRWGVAADHVSTRRGIVFEKGGKRTLTYGQLASEAMSLPVPTGVALKNPKTFTLIGHPTRRLDSPAKVNGTAQFGMDVRLPNMRVAMIARPPVFGGKVTKVDDARARAVPGVEAVLQVPLDRGGTGVAVVAKGYWPAHQGRDALDIQWDLPAGPTTATQLDQYRAMLLQPGAVARADGDAKAIDRAAKRIEADYEFPYLAHAAMEPLNATAELKADSLTLWSGTQFQTVDQGAAAKAAGLKPEQVKIVTLFAGGGFGRRANPNSDFMVEAVNVAKAMRQAGIEAPVKVIWSREDDMHGGYYRPLHLHQVRVGLDEHSMPLAWHHSVVGQSIAKGTLFEKMMIKDGVDGLSVEGIVDTPYRLPNMRVEAQHPDVNVPVLWWRSVGNTHTAFVMETMIDEMAHAAGKDPIEYRLSVLDPKSTRQRAALELVRRTSGWNEKLPSGRARGVAMHTSFGSAVAQVAEVSVDQGRIRVHKVTCAIDCGVAVNPMTVEAQVTSAVAFGLTAALYGRITLKDGKVEQSNFPDYPVLRFNEMPQISVHIVPSTADPTGLGEPGTPPIAPAVANALARLTGKRFRRLPFDLSAA
ncbi:MAG TPA: xanthine dehydrogenase family protein molybdopterin-binding subunit [Burkholderiaceae bacterium]|nr:xanthine dehydrogenase family protein molybdopterin-binding subunit [Burkholderiaceae bacterium]